MQNNWNNYPYKMQYENMNGRPWKMTRGPVKLNEEFAE